PAFAIEIAEVAHAVDDAGAFADLGQPGLHVAMEVGVGGGRAGDGDLADHARRDPQFVVPFDDRVVLDPDHAHLVRRHRAADAGAGAGLGGGAGGFEFAPFDHRHRQAFGGAVGRPELRV